MAPKNKKGTPMSLGNFLGDQSLGSWADEMEDMPMPYQKGYGRISSFQQAGPRPERDDRGFHIQARPELPLPTAPPFTAHLGNLSYEVTQGDVEDFFAGCEVTNVRIVEDKIERKPKGFGYVEFGTLDGLKKALTLNGSSFQNRAVRISVADPPKDRPDQRTFDDWSRKGPLPDLGNRRVSQQGPPGRSFDARSDAGSERGGYGMERGGSRRGNTFFQDDTKTRDFSNWERKGPPTPVDRAPPSREGRPGRGMDRGFERRPSPAAQWGEGRSQDSGSRPPRPVPERQPTAAEMDNQWRARMKPDAPPASDKPSASPTPEPSAPTSPTAAPPAPSTRPKLNLAKRTLIEVPTEATVSSAESRSSNIFGSAKPIDTATKEAEVEKKRAIARKAKEEEDKARQERKETENAAKAEEKKARGESTPSTPTASGIQENGAGRKNSEQQNGEKKEERGKGAQYEILRRVTNDGEEGDDATSAREEDAEGEILGDKSVKPKEVVREMNTDEQTTPSAEGMEEEGWSTITSEKSKRGHRKRNSMAATRALAS